MIIVDKTAAIIFLLLIMGCTSSLEGVEVREYQGEKLSSISAFRENSIKGAQHVNIEDYTLTIDGVVNKTIRLSYDEVLGYDSYTKVVTLYCVEGWSAKILWEGVLVKELIETAGVLEEADTIIFHAYDGYTTSLPLDYVVGNNILLAYKMNGATLPPERGYPFQLVAEDKWGYKWIKWVTEIELSDDVNYRGFWESRGYSNEGDLSKNFFSF